MNPWICQASWLAKLLLRFMFWFGSPCVFCWLCQISYCGGGEWEWAGDESASEQGAGDFPDIGWTVGSLSAQMCESQTTVLGRWKSPSQQSELSTGKMNLQALWWFKRCARVSLDWIWIYWECLNEIAVECIDLSMQWHSFGSMRNCLHYTKWEGKS